MATAVMMPRLVWLVAVLVFAALAAGCANRTPEGATVQEQRQTLAARPTIDEVTDRYERMQAELRQRLVAEIGISEWAKDTELSGSGCSDYPNIGGESRSLGTWSSEGNLPDARWSQAVAIVTEVTSRYGFSPPETVLDRPSEHQIRATDQYGASYIFGTAVNTVLGVSTGCHLNPEDSSTR